MCRGATGPHTGPDRREARPVGVARGEDRPPSVAFTKQHASGPAVDTARLRAEIDGDVREANELMRARISEALRRELTPKVVVAGNESSTQS